MLSIAIYIAEGLVLVLLGFLGAKAYSLAKKQSRELASTAPAHTADIDDEVIMVDEPPRAERYEVRLEALKEAQIFAGVQMVPLKREFEDILDPQLLWLREAVALYLIGASDLIAKKANCDQKTRNKFNSLILSTNLKLDEVELAKTLYIAANREKDSDEDQMILAGAKAAAQWKATGSIKDSLKLRTRLNDWGVFA